eukprot:CAMPEP_0174702480 /NCGR_PEP_ID=MMETSP1094-20130205/6750_1 /TAXON_ID=156173 /ORGANISM="Chrysochromulina brevifilum, Strain UTEX LB 985" /LENGTH=235 /DNA_ID=CAMNT_0015900259 /DNA_START=156 /DNA_END=860 /DNA_ORIENTATION=+
MICTRVILIAVLAMLDFPVIAAPAGKNAKGTLMEMKKDFEMNLEMNANDLERNNTADDKNLWSAGRTASVMSTERMTTLGCPCKKNWEWPALTTDGKVINQQITNYCAKSTDRLLTLGQRAGEWCRVQDPTRCSRIFGGEEDWGFCAVLQPCTLNGCPGRHMDPTTHVCTHFKQASSRTNGDWQACPYQLPGNWRWHVAVDTSGVATKCSPPPEGEPGYGPGTGPEIYEYHAAEW